MNRGNFLFELRKSRGLSQNDIALFLGYSPQLISLWEKDKTSPDLAIISKYASKLDTDLDGFINCNDTKNNDNCDSKNFDIKSFSIFIKKLRKESGLLQNDVAKKIGVNVKSVSAWENMSSTPSIEQFVALSKLFNLSYDELYFCYKNDNKKVVIKPHKRKKKKYLVPLLVLVGLLTIGGAATGITFAIKNNRSGGGGEIPLIDFKDNLVIDKVANKAVYGYYPQTKVIDQDTLDSLNNISEPSIDNKYLFNNDYYEKYNNSWYKCDEISWIIIANKDDEYTLVSEKLLDVEVFYHSNYDRTIDDKIVHATNYEYSEIREWLNNTFYQSAFFLHNSHISSVEIDNSPGTTDSEDNPNCCSNTIDKVFLLSYQEYSSLDVSIRRARHTTLTIDKGGYNDSGYGYHWTRSPSSSCEWVPWCVDQYGNLYTNYGGDVTVTNCGVRPCIVVKE